MQPAASDLRLPLLRATMRATLRSIGRPIPGTSRRLRNMYRISSLFTHPAHRCLIAERIRW